MIFLKILIPLAFILFPLGSLGRLSFFGQQVNIYFYEAGLAAALLILLFKYKLSAFKEVFARFKILFIFFTWLVFTFLLGVGNFGFFENFVAFLYLLRMATYGLYFFYLFHLAKIEPRLKRIVAYGIYLAITMTIVFSIIQYFLYPNLGNLSYLGWDRHLYRMFGLFFDTSVAGAVYGLFFFFGLFYSSKMTRRKSTKILLLFVFLVFIVLTFSRNLFFAFLTTCIFYLISRKKAKFILFLLAAFLFLIILAPKSAGEGVNLTRIFSISSRIADYQIAAKMWEKNPLAGIGYNRIRYMKQRMNLSEGYNFDLSHAGASFSSSFLIILVSGGLIGLVLFVLVLIRLATINPAARYFILFLALLSFADNIFLHPFVLFLILNILVV